MAKIKVRLLVARSGEYVSNVAGDEITVESAEAKRLIEAGQAEAVSSSKRDKAETL